MKCFPATSLTIQGSVPLQVALFWREGLFLAIADRNSLTTRRRELLDTPAVPYTGCQTHTKSFNLSLCPSKNTSAGNGGNKRRWICPRSSNVLGHPQSANLKGNRSVSGSGLEFSHFIPLSRGHFHPPFICDMKD